MLARHLDLLRAVHVGEESEAEALRVGRVCEAINSERGLRRVECLAYTGVELIVRHTAPVLWLRVRHRLRVCNTNNTTLNSKAFLLNKVCSKQCHLPYTTLASFMNNPEACSISTVHRHLL